MAFVNFISCPRPAPRANESWAYIHQPPTMRDVDVADEHDVFETVAAAEEEALEYSTTNPERNITMTKSTTRAAKTFKLPADNAVIPSNLVITPETTMPSHHNYFDPIDTLEDHLGNFPQAHTRVLNSAVWTLDIACINAARNILFTRYAESELDANTEDRFGTFCQDVAEMLSHDSFYDCGEDTPESTLAALMALRLYWHDCAAAAYSADNRDYNPKSLDDLLLSEKPRVADAGTQANYAEIARHEARGDEAKQKRFMDAFMEADRLAATQRAESNRGLIPVLSIILSTVGRYAPASTRFDELPLNTQRKLVKAIHASFGRVKLDVAKALKNETIMFGHVLEAMYQCTEAIDKVLATKYTEVGELEYAGMSAAMTKQAREQKANAAARE